MRKRKSAGADDLRNLYRQGEIWYLKIQIGGKEHRESLRTAFLPEAQKRRDQRIAELKGDLHSWVEAIEMWHLDYLPHNVKPGTATRYLSSIGQIRMAMVTGPLGQRTTLEQLCAEQITVKTVSEVVAWSKKHRPGLTHATLRRDLTALSSVLHMTVGLGWRQDNPAKVWDRSHVKERRDPILLPTAAEIDRIAAATTSMMTAGIRMAQFTGMRLEELFSLTWAQISPDQRSVTLTKTKNGRVRVVPLDSRAVSILVGIPRHITCPYVLWHQESDASGRPCASRFLNASSIFARARAKENNEQAGKMPPITFKFHDLRHWFAVEYLHRRAGSIYDLQGILGHGSVKTTELYLDFLDPETRKFAVRHVGMSV